MNILQKILSEHFAKTLDFCKVIRPCVYENVTKSINCGKTNYAVFKCNCCGETKHVPFRCKSRFCTTCGNLYNIKRATSMQLKLLKCKHRHCVFTIPAELRIYFLRDRKLLDLLFQATSDTIFYMFNKMNKSQQFKPAFISVLHTFGRDLKWNPHIHVVLAEGGCGKTELWRNINHFNYTALRNSFRYCLLELLHKNIGNSFYKMKCHIYKNSAPNGFFVYAKSSLLSSKNAIKYIGRYLGRPVIAMSRIDYYDGENVSFHYNRHEDNSLVYETVSAVDFIKKLIIHIPDKYFHMIRYYGIYARKPKNLELFLLRVSQKSHHIYKVFSTWRFQMQMAFKIDPLWCERCNCRLSFDSLVFKKPLNEICLNSGASP